jgi:hypothetical protein
MKACLPYHGCRGKAISIKYSLVIQHAKRMRRIKLSSVVASLALPYFSTFRKTVTEYKVSFEFLHNFVWNISYFKDNSARRKMDRH